MVMTSHPPYTSPLPPLPSYIYSPPHPSPPPPHPSLPPPAYTSQLSSQREGVTILLSCPRLSSYSWCLKLYAMVMGGVGVLFSVLWVVGHGYVLGQTEESSLRMQR